MAGELKIFTLGNFKVANSGEIITKNIKKSSKRWKLLQYLITFNNQEISRDELIMILGLNNNGDPESSLSALVYRLRNLLNKYTKKVTAILLRHQVQLTPLMEMQITGLIQRSLKINANRLSD